MDPRGFNEIHTCTSFLHVSFEPCLHLLLCVVKEELCIFNSPPDHRIEEHLVLKAFVDFFVINLLNTLQFIKSGRHHWKN